jgi:asparagine synthase (glutamine-hydrolysing)
VCGIAGIIDLEAQRTPDVLALRAMSATLVHRGPDESGELLLPGIAMASRRLSIVGLQDGKQPVFNEDGTVAVVFNGELFDHRELRRDLEQRGHQFRTSCDTEVLVHLWEEHGEAMFTRLRGQYGIALNDQRQKVTVLARDRMGVCPLYWAQRDGWLYFASEMKALLASGHLPIAADRRGLDHMFTFFAAPARRTVFEGITALEPGHYVKICLGDTGGRASVKEHRYWQLDFPDEGHEHDPADKDSLVEEFRSTFSRAVERRLQADVPVVSYLSGGIDSASVLAVASRVQQRAPASFTIRIPTRRFDESARAAETAKLLGSRNTIIDCDSAQIADAYPRVVRAADCPVIDTSCAALWMLSGEVHRQGFKVALTGEGADEALAGYPWFKIQRLLSAADFVPGLSSAALSRLCRRLAGKSGPGDDLRRMDALLGGPLAQTEMYHLVSLARRRFYSPAMFDALGGHTAYDDLELDVERMRRWHPLNRSLYLGYKTILPGLLLNHKGDRVAMAHSVETRYPFLDEEVIDLCARVHPRWKLHSLRRDKHLLRCAARAWLPRETVDRPKAMFRAPFALTFFSCGPAWVSQLLSHESLEKTGYFDATKVRTTFAQYQRRHFPGRMFHEMGMVAVLATQLWHHLYLGGNLCELPTAR